ncbi:MAG: hypothetical protein HY825_01505 [Acidobacteria bacterium]|nr:hypothetical protein [Acidobacteriota bacterium]
MDRPGESADLLRESGAGAFVELEPGRYDLDAHVLLASHPPTESEPTLPDYLIVIRPRSGSFAPLEEEPHLRDVTEDDVAEIIARASREITS